MQATAAVPVRARHMARDPGWTRALGDAFLAEREAVMDWVQRMRHYVYDYGYLRRNDSIAVTPVPILRSFRPTRI